MDASKEKPSIENIEFEGGKDINNNIQQANGDIVLLSGSDEIRKIPVPTDDPNDPLNFSTLRKWGIVVTCCWFSIFSLIAVSGTGAFMATLYGMYIPQGHTPEEVTGLSTYSTMVMAFGCLGLLPLAFIFGRRPVFLFAVLLCFVTNITAATAKDFNAHLISRIFLGIGTGATESLLPLILSDVTFLHERSFYFGLYWSVQNCVNAGLQISNSYLVAASLWRMFYWFFAVTLGLSTLLVVFLAPETKFQRSPTLLNGQVIYTDEFGTTRIVTDPIAIAQYGELERIETRKIVKKSFMQELKPWSDVTTNGFSVWLNAYIKIGKAATAPGIIYSLLVSSISLGVAIGITLVYSSVLEQGYGWNAKSVGLFNLTRRNSSVHKPEHHLVHLIIPTLTGIIGIVAIAIGAQWPERYSAWGMVIGWAIYEFSFTCILITTTTFAAEVIPENPGAGVVVVVGGKNLVSFGAAYGIVPMTHVFSYIKTFMILMGIFISICLLGIPVYFLNSKWRKITGKEPVAEQHN
ncbi:hypothetical protein COCCADRAFT_41778 [Bipolaris zeicola 26-R-13]|uniref:Major facilitator superfamily (MFS) profile domain-containing protein n=1 Tax=Cochliobolus carbonum (strain 26-R-13) TaxID=930089 RepID=W6XQC3_COCC2|nr:uncharacterized protein COCCADRAFT_41778 [Bipolaris zeicola 26-R-13]EUC27515.1 hypothetical protein COCCADRAFT_41778 [Bipolaris zeicola 26-R-13]